MCELFSMSSLKPSSVTFSLEEFARHGGLTGPHKDGWGIAFYEDNDVRLIKEANAATSSPCMNFVKSHNFSSKNVISHIRKATQGQNNLRNTQPFCREVRGKMHTFAHNGDLVGIHSDPKLQLNHYFPVGDTDSEYAFCYLMKLMEELWSLKKDPGIEERYQIVSQFANLIREFGPANFIYSDSEFVFAHGHKRSQAGKKGFFPPGLHYLCRTCSEQSSHRKIDGLGIDVLSDQQEIVLIASVPLTDEDWIPLEENEIVILKDGRVINLPS